MIKKRFRVVFGFITILVLLAFVAGFIWVIFGREYFAATAAGRLNVSDAESAADRIYSEVQPARFSSGGGYPVVPMPSAFKPASPKSMRITDDGIYLKTNSFFVEEDGVFILKKDTEFDPSGSVDPEYDHVSGRVYTYHFSG